MRALLPVVFASVLAACGGKVGLAVDFVDPPGVDAGADTWGDARIERPALPDASPPSFDVAPPPDADPPPTGCETPLPPSFTCVAPTPGKGQKACTEAALQKIVAACFSGSGSGCDAARKAEPACGRCILEDWIDNNMLAVGACVQAISPGDPCATTVKCTYDCLAEVCGSCDPTPGSGSGGTSEMDACYSAGLEPGRACYARVGAEYEVCFSKPELSVCFPADIDAVIPFYRGACRDGGDWSKATSP